MSGYLKQSAAAYIDLGPFVAASDGKTRLTTLSIAKADVLVSKNGGTMGAKSHNSACSHLSAGVYRCPLAAGDVNTLGRLRLEAVKTSALPVWETISVLPANIYDSLVGGTDKIQVDLVQVLGVDQTASLNGIKTDTSALAARATELRLAELDAANLPADVAAVLTKANSIKVNSSAIAAKLPSKAYLTGTANSDGDLQANEATGNFPGSVASVAGAVASVTGNVGGNIVGSVASVVTKTGYELTSVYDAIKTAAQQSSLSAVAAKVDAVKVDTSAVAAVDFAGLTSALGAIDTSALGSLTDVLGSLDASAIASLSDGIVAVRAGVSALPAVTKTALEVAGGYLERLHRRAYGKAAMTATELKVFADDGVTAVTTQTLSDDGTTQTQGAAT